MPFGIGRGFTIWWPGFVYGSALLWPTEYTDSDAEGDTHLSRNLRQNRTSMSAGSKTGHSRATWPPARSTKSSSKSAPLRYDRQLPSWS